MAKRKKSVSRKRKTVKRPKRTRRKKAEKKAAKKRTVKAAKKKVKKSKKRVVSRGGLILFFGEECPHCSKMALLVDRLDAELGVKVRRVEVWHNASNERLMRGHEKVIRRACGGGLGVPAFVNLKTGEALCGEQSYEVLRAWAKGEL